MLQYFFFFYFCGNYMSFLVKVKEIYRKYITNKTIPNHQLAMPIACSSDCWGPCPSCGRCTWGGTWLWVLSLSSLSLFFAYAQQQLQTWLKSQWIPEKARVKHDKKILKITTS